MTNELANLTSVSANPVYVYLSSLVSARSRHAMMSGLRSSLAIVRNAEPQEISDDQVYNFPWHQLQFAHLQAIRTKLIEADYAPSTINTYIAAIRGVLTQAWKLELISADAYARITDIKPVKETKMPAGRYISPEEIRSAIHICLSDKNRIQGIRDAAVLAFMYGVGARREEVVSLVYDSFNSDYTMVTIYGKGRKERKVPVPSSVQRYLYGWQATHINMSPVDLTPQSPFFVAVRKNGSLGDTHLTTTTVWNIVVERFKQAGLKPVSPHSFRRSMATNYLDQGENEGTVASIGGWASVQLVQRYNRHKEKQMQSAADRLDLDI